jgi:hypothetical protein
VQNDLGLGAEEAQGRIIAALRQPGTDPRRLRQFRPEWAVRGRQIEISVVLADQSWHAAEGKSRVN